MTTTTTTRNTNTETPLTAIQPRHMDALHNLTTNDPETFAVVVASIRKQASRVTDLDRSDVASLATIFAPLLAEGTEPTHAAAVAVRRACRLLRNEAATAPDSLDAITDERGECAERIAAPWTPDPAAPYSTTNRDRYADTLGALDAADRWTAHALLSATWKGGKVPAAAVRTGHALPPVTGRAGTAWTAAVAADADRLGITYRAEYGPTLDPTGALADLYRSTLAVHHGKRRRTLDDAAREADEAHKLHAEPTTYGNRPTPSSGPASTPRTAWSQRTADRLGTLDGSTRRRATEADRRAALDAEAARQRLAPLDLDPFKPEPKKRPSAAAVLDGLADAVTDEAGTFDPMATTADHRTAQRLPGVTVDAEGVAVAPSGSGAGMSGSGSGSAVQTARPSRKAKGGSTGATVPVGGSRGPAVVQAITGGKPSAAGMGSKVTPCRCDDDAATFCTFHAVALAETHAETHRLDLDASA